MIIVTVQQWLGTDLFTDGSGRLLRLLLMNSPGRAWQGTWGCSQNLNVWSKVSPERRRRVFFCFFFPLSKGQAGSGHWRVCHDRKSQHHLHRPLQSHLTLQQNYFASISNWTSHSCLLLIRCENWCCECFSFPEPDFISKPTRNLIEIIKMV